MYELFQRIHDWYILNRDRFWQTRDPVIISGDHGFLDAGPTIDDSVAFYEASHRSADRAIEETLQYLE